ncbi:MAG: helix-hairpin-helix domain-containing protein [Bacillota bacterium]
MRSAGRPFEAPGLTRAEVAALALVVALVMAWGGLLVWRHYAGAGAVAGGPGLSAKGGPGSGAGTAGASGSGGQAGEGPTADGQGSGGPDGEAAPLIVVHVAGAVKEPGVYKLPQGSRVVDALTAAGGVTTDAAADWLNLAAKVVDGEKVYVPNKKEVAAARGTGAATGRGGTASGGAGGLGGLAGPGSTGGGALAPPGVGLVGGKVNLNLADQAALETLPGIGPALAQRILAYRTSHGSFQSIEELRNVSGIGERKFAEIKDLVAAP